MKKLAVMAERKSPQQLKLVTLAVRIFLYAINESMMIWIVMFNYLKKEALSFEVRIGIPNTRDGYG